MSAPEPSALRLVDPPRVERRIGVGLVVAALLVYAFFSSYGLTAPFYYGHFGYHGGSYATWARGTLRHHTLYPVNEPGFAPPNPQTYYVHHPVLTHQFVTLTFALFGEHEWSVRLGSLIPSTAALLLVALIAFRALGPLAGGAAALVFAFVPVNIWYGSHMDQGFPSIAFLLAFFWFYLRWLEQGRWRTAVAALVCEALAGCFEWSPYFAFVMIFAHVAWTGLRRRRRYLAFAALHPLVVIVPLATHFWAVWHAHLLDDIFTAYRNRTAEIAYKAFSSRMVEYGDTLFGRMLLGVMFGWLILVAVRCARGRGRAVDLVGATFALTVLTYIHVFENAVVTHAYRQMYGNVWAALAVADLTVEARKLGLRLWQRMGRRQPARGLSLALSLGVLAVVTLGTLPVSWAGLMESRLHGGVPGWKVFNPDLRQTAFSSAINKMTTPADKLYFHSSFPYPPPHRMDWAFYYDRDLRRWQSLRGMTALPPALRQHAVVILHPAQLRDDELRAFGELAGHHPVFQVDNLAAIDLRTEGARVLAFRLAPVVQTGRGPLRRWLDGPYPFPSLAADEPARAALVAQIARAKASLPDHRVPVPVPVQTPPAPAAIQGPRRSTGPARAAPGVAAPAGGAAQRR